MIRDTDDDGTPDHLDVDDDGDGIPTAMELGTGTTPVDTDGDGRPNFRDADDDDDGIPTRTERTDGMGLSGGPDDDVDDDGMPNWLDTDADGDGVPDMTEGTGDADGDGDPNYLDRGAATGAGLSGGALCAASPARTGSAWVLLLTALAVLVWRRRR